MADSSGLLVSMDSLKRSWVEQFARAIKPAVEADFTLLWHCDGNLMELLPHLIEAGVNGFQGFQYEDGMDYINICKLKAKNGKSMVIQGGVSVTRELPMGTPDDIKKQLNTYRGKSILSCSIWFLVIDLDITNPVKGTTPLTKTI